MEDVQFPQPTAYLTGRRLGNYRLIKRLGRGGSATVYLGEHRYLGTLAAVKVLRPELVRHKLEQFIGEARTAAHLLHPHIIRVWEFDLHGRIPYLVMEYAPNHTLRDRHSRGQRLSLTRVVQYVKQVADALQYIHDHGLIHQDVKPENMLIGKDQRILLGDFGISVAAHQARASGQEVVGTIAYMAPEQIRSEPCVASDQYALGVVVYEWLTGRLPFEGSSHDIIHEHLYYAPPPLRNAVPTLPLAVERVVLKALSKRPEERFGSAQAFAEALEQAYNQSLAPSRRSRAKRPRPERRTQQSLLREAAGLLAASCVIGIVLGIILRVLGLELERFWLLLVLLIIGFPLVVALRMRNKVAFLFVSSMFVVSAFFGLVCHSTPVFFWIYGIASFFMILVAFSLGIQKDASTHSPL